MNNNNKNISKAFLGAFLGFIPIAGSGILFVLSLTKKKYEYLAVSSACLITLMVNGLTHLYEYSILGENTYGILIFSSLIAYVVSFIFSVRFFYYCSNEPYLLLYPDPEQTNTVATDRKLLNGTLGFILGFFPIAVSVSCFLLAVKRNNFPGYIISLLYLLFVITMMKTIGLVSIPFILIHIVFMVFASVLFANFLVYIKKDPASNAG